MKRKSFILILFLLAAVFSFNSAYAESQYDISETQIFDDAGFLTASQIDSLNWKSAQVSSEYKCSICVYYTNTYYPYQSIADFADSFFENNHLGYGDGEDGILLLVTNSEREYWISTSGMAIDAFTDYGLEQIENSIVDYLSAGDFNKAAEKYISLCNSYLKQAQSGPAYDTNNTVKNHFSPTALLGDSCIGLALSGLFLRKRKKELETVSSKKDASGYSCNNLILTKKDDSFITSNVVRVPIPKNDVSMHSSGNMGGGSSIHISPGGHTHGGSGGKF